MIVAVSIIMLVAAKQANGIYAHLESVGLFPVSDVAYQFFDDLGGELALLIVSILLMVGAHARIYILGGIFIGIFTLADMAGLVLNPMHYDSFIWEIGCGMMAALCTLTYHVATRRRIRVYELGTPKVDDKAASPPFVKASRIGFDYKGRQ
jgi:hypothetical protein